MKIFGVGLIGCGRISKNHVDALTKIPDAKLIAVSDTNEQAVKDTADRFACRGYGNYKAMLEQTDVDMVFISTPSGLHARMAIDALEAGKHVLVEKPMALSLKEADAVIAAARKAGKKLGVVYPTRYNPAVKRLRKAVEAGLFGKITHGSAVVRWNRNDEYYAQAPWRGTFALDGGCLMNQAIHSVDLLQWMLGPVESVFGQTATNLRKIEGEDLGIAVIKFKNGALGTVEATTTVYPVNLEEKLSFFGGTGTVVIGGKGFSSIETWRFPEENSPTDESSESSEGHLAVIEDFIAAVRTGIEPMVNGDEGRKALELVLAMYHSAKSGQEIKLPLKEKFTIGLGL